MKSKFITSLLLVLTIAFSTCFFACDDGETLTPLDLPNVGDTVGLGLYPQSDVTAELGESLSSVYAQVLPSADNANGWTSYGYYANEDNGVDFAWYIDVDTDNDGVKDYRGVYFDAYRPIYTNVAATENNSYQSRNGYDTGTVYWFKYEPIKWTVLTVDGGKATLFAQFAIDCRDIYFLRTDRQDGIHANNYAESAVRAWLNGSFLNTAFNELERSYLGTVAVDNSARSANPDENATYYFDGANQFACENTNDKVFLLSAREATMAENRFNTAAGTKDIARQKMPTDYAKCQGIDVPVVSNSTNYNACWWLRSPFAMQSYNTMYVDQNGILNAMPGDFVNRTNYGIVPAIQVVYS